MRTTVLCLTLFAAAACGSSDTSAPVVPGTGTPAANQVFMQSAAFTPTTRTVTAGTSVQWVNQDGITHNVTSSSVPAGASAIASGSMAGSGVFSVTLNTPGTYQYFCSIHGTATTGMHATIVVN